MQSRNILFVEPDYRSKFPPLGLMRLSTYHRQCNDSVKFVRGCQAELRKQTWDRVYVSSLFTFELPRTVSTLQYYLGSVRNPSTDLVVGGIGATLMPEYIRGLVPCRVITGAIDKEGIVEAGSQSVSQLVPDYNLISDYEDYYRPHDAYFGRITVGCIRNCGFCAVPKLEPEFAYLQSIREQWDQATLLCGERTHLVILDNNILACSDFARIASELCDIGFFAGAKLGKKKRTLDFNQGLDARLIDDPTAKILGSLCVSPVRLAFDYDGVEEQYCNAVKRLAGAGFREFVTYVMFNFKDSPDSFYHRLITSVELSTQLGIRVTSFPMKYAPIDATSRKYIAANWHWRLLRGIQCVLNATHGIVSPKADFFNKAFGASQEEFLEILSMPDKYIIYREQYRNNEAAEWLSLYRKLSITQRNELYGVIYQIHMAKQNMSQIGIDKGYIDIIKHYK